MLVFGDVMYSSFLNVTKLRPQVELTSPSLMAHKQVNTSFGESGAGGWWYTLIWVYVNHCLGQADGPASHQRSRTSA